MADRESCAFGVNRRDLVRGAGLFVSAAVGTSLLAPRCAAANGGAGPRTTLVDFDGRTAWLKTSPVPSVALPAGGRLGLCLVAGGGSQGAGPRLAIGGVGAAEIVGVGRLAADRGIESSVYRMLGGFDTVRPAELYGLSMELGTALQPGQSLEVTWQVTLQGDATTDDLQRYLRDYHAFVLGEVSENGRFRGHVQFVEVSRSSDEESHERPRRQP